MPARQQNGSSIPAAETRSHESAPGHQPHHRQIMHSSPNARHPYGIIFPPSAQEPPESSSAAPASPLPLRTRLSASAGSSSSAQHRNQPAQRNSLTAYPVVQHRRSHLDRIPAPHHPLQRLLQRHSRRRIHASPQPTSPTHPPAPAPSLSIRSAAAAHSRTDLQPTRALPSDRPIQIVIRLHRRPSRNTSVAANSVSAPLSCVCDSSSTTVLICRTFVSPHTRT